MGRDRCAGDSSAARREDASSAHYRIKCFGVGESDLEAMLPDLIARNRYPLVGITVHQATITLRITAEGETAEAARASMQPTIKTIQECLGDLIFGEEDDELEDAVVQALRRQTQQTLVTFEWGTCGIDRAVAGRIRKRPTFFTAGIVGARLSWRDGTVCLHRQVPDYLLVTGPSSASRLSDHAAGKSGHRSGHRHSSASARSFPSLATLRSSAPALPSRR